MQLTELFLRALDTQGAVYQPYSFNGDWDEWEIEQVKIALEPFVPVQVDAMFNNWIFSKSYISECIFVSRATWDLHPVCVDSLDGLLEWLQSYYRRFDDTEEG